MIASYNRCESNNSKATKSPETLLVGTLSQVPILSVSKYKITSHRHHPPGHQMGEREEDEGTADVEDIVGGQTHHQEMEVSLSSPAAEHQDADGVADEADAEHYQLKKYHYYLHSYFI